MFFLYIRFYIRTHSTVQLIDCGPALTPEIHMAHFVNETSRGPQKGTPKGEWMKAVENDLMNCV